MSHGCVEHASFAVHSSPGCGIVWALIVRAIHSLSCLHEDHMKIGSEILKGIPFIFDSELFLKLLAAWKLWRDEFHRRFLLWPMPDKLASNHLNVGIALFDSLCGKSFASAVECVRCTMRADKPFSRTNGIQ